MPETRTPCCDKPERQYDITTDTFTCRNCNAMYDWLVVTDRRGLKEIVTGARFYVRGTTTADA